MKRFNQSFIIALAILLTPSLIFALFTEKPRWQRGRQAQSTEQRQEDQSDPSQEKSKAAPSPFAISKTPDKSSKPSGQTSSPQAKDTTQLIASSDITILRDEAQKAIIKKDYITGLEKLRKIPDPMQTQTDQQQIRRLAVILTVKQNEKDQPELLKSDSEVDAATMKQVQSLFAKGENIYALGQEELARDFLIQTLFLHRRYFNAREFLKLGYGLAPGSYKVEDMQAKYWKQSEIFFYGGNYERALIVLDILTNFDKENYKIYERMGSTQYMLGEKKKALEAWTTALFLNPGNTQLEQVIARTKEIMEEEQKQAEEAAIKSQEKKADKKEEIPQTETQSLGVFPTQTQAYAYAQKLREQKLNAIVEELGNGKWAVKVPKSQLSKRTSQ
jgi:tetratricopeptide (TPR) repeat protein